jgi:hypothetical protein
VAEALGYDEAVAVLRRALAEAGGGARAFEIRARARPQLLSARSWHELAVIETLLAERLATALSRELRVSPWRFTTRARAGVRFVSGALVPEARAVRGVFERTRAHPVERWRAAAPQLEATLWPFFSARTRYLANVTALALSEPAPYPPLLWHPARREFLDRG